MPKAIGYLVAAAGVAYLVGSYTRFLFPDFAGTVAPIYLVPVISELTLCMWLLLKGVNLVRWKGVAGSAM